MVIAIDGYEANVRHRVGIGRYAFEMLRHLFEEVKSQKSKVKRGSEINFRIYLPNQPLPDMPPETSWWQYRIAFPQRLWTLVGLPLALALDKSPADVVFSPTHYVPRFINIPRVMAIMDLSYLSYPEMFRPKDLHQLINWTAYSVRQAKKIFTISEFSKNAIIKAYGVAPERVVVTYPGITMKLKVKSEKLKVFRKYQLPPNYILSVGTIQPRKNYVRLIEAFAKALKSLASDYPDLTLAIVGKHGWLYQETLEAPQKLGVADRVKFLDFVPDSDLPDLYREALCFALPSLYEGFGLPVLEAMAYGCPVVVSNTSSLPEIAGPAGIYVKPEDVDSITHGLIEALKERDTEKGKKRLQLGLAQVKEFSWEKAAKQTLKVLTQVGKGEV